MKSKLTMKDGVRVHKSAKVGAGVVIWYGTQVGDGAKIGENTIVGNNVYIDEGVIIGKNCKIQSGALLFKGVEICDGVFIGPQVCFTNDMYPRATNSKGKLKSSIEWKMRNTKVMNGASIGANSTILPGVVIGQYAMVGAGSVVTKSVEKYGLVFGNPAKQMGIVNEEGLRVRKLKRY